MAPTAAPLLDGRLTGRNLCLDVHDSVLRLTVSDRIWSGVEPKHYRLRQAAVSS